MATDPTRLDDATLLALLRRAGSRLADERTLAAAFADGAPRNPDGSANLYAFLAWAIREVADREKQ